MKAFYFTLLAVICASFSLSAQQYADQLITSGPCKPIIAVSCPSGVEKPGNLVDGDKTNYATMVSNVGTSLILNTSFVEVGFSTPVAAGSVINLMVGEQDQELNIDVLQQLAVKGYTPAGQEVFSSEGLSLLNVGLLTGDDAKRILTIPTELGNYEISRVRIEFTGVVNVSQKIELYSVYAEAGCPPVGANFVVNSTNTTNPGFAVDEDRESAAILDLPLNLLSSASLEVGFNNPASPGDFVGFEVSRANVLLGLGLIENLTISALNANGEVIDSKNDFKLTDLILLESVADLLGPVLGTPGNSNTKAVVGFHAGAGTTDPIASIKIEISPAVGLLLDLAVYSGFYYSDSQSLRISQSVFTISQGQTAVLTASGNYASYAWSNGDVGKVATVTEPGKYTVTATRFDGCDVSASVLVRDANCSQGFNPNATQVIASGACESFVPLLCPSGVENAENAIDGDYNTFATLVAQLGVSLLETSAFIELGFDAPQQGGSDLNFIIRPLTETLNVDVLQQVVVTAYDVQGNEILREEEISTQDVQLLSGSGGQSLLTLATPVGNYKIARVRFEIEALVNVLQDLAFYGMYTDCSCPAISAPTVVNSVSASNVDNIVDGDPTTFGSLDIPLGITNSASVELSFPDVARSGDFVGFVVGANNELLDAGVIGEVDVVLLDALGNEISRFNDFTLADLVAAEQAAGLLGGLLGISGSEGNAYVIGGIVPGETEQVKNVRLELNPVIGLLNSLRVYNAFYKEATANIAITASSEFACDAKEITLSAPEGFASYLWSNGETTREIVITEAGKYSVTVGRVTGCPAFASYVVKNSVLDIQGTVTNSNCNQANGIISLDVLNGSGNYSYSWSNGADTREVTTFTAGIYDVTVTDLTTGCSATKNFVISDEDAPKYAAWVRHANCGSNDGAIFLTLPAGTTINWSNGEQTPIIRNLAPGIYFAEVSFANGCKRFASYRVISRTDFQLSAEVTPSLCNEATGGIAITIGAAGDYAFEWSNGLNTKDLVGLAPGVYTLVVTNVANQCQDIIHVNVSTVGAADINLVELKEEVCARDENGVIEISVNTVGNPTFEWNSGQTTPRIENLGPGLYTVKVRDDLGCEAHAIFPLVARDAMISTVNATDTDCDPPFNGTATANAEEGRAPYNFAWSNGEVTAAITNLAEDTYTVTITDFNGCAQTQEAIVNKLENCKSNPPNPPNPEIDETVGDLNNIYTPNGDGVNDTWVLGIDLDSFDSVGLRIVNIYGTEVFKVDDYNNEWDGTYRDSKDNLPEGSYYFQVDLTRGSASKKLVGFVTLKR